MRGAKRRSAGQRGSRQQVVEGSVRQSPLHGDGGTDACTSAGSCLGVLAVVRVLDSAHGLSSSSQRPHPRAIFSDLENRVWEDNWSKAAAATGQSQDWDPVHRICVLSSRLLPGLSRHLQEERLGDLPPALGRPRSPGFCVCQLRSPRTWYYASPLHHPCPPERGCARRFTGGQAVSFQELVTWCREAVMCTLISSLGLLDSPVSAQVTANASCLYISLWPLASVPYHLVFLPLTAPAGWEKLGWCCLERRN